MPVKHLIGHAHRTLAIKPIPGNQVMISGGWRGKWNNESRRGETIPNQVEGNRKEAVAVYPALADIPIVEATADRLELVSVDGIPIIDRVLDTNMLVGAGWSGHGWAIAPAVGKLLAEWALSDEKPALFEPFRYGRFTR
jgi:sarcosine oxidase subunit beta